MFVATSGMVLLGLKKITMSKSSNNVVMHGHQGMVGDMLVFKQVNGKTVVAMRPRKSNKPPTEGQLQRQEKFLEATIYAKNAVNDPVLKPIYDALAGGGKTAYNVAIADFLKSPVLSKVITENYSGAVGEQIKIRAVDNVKVESLSLSIFAADDTLIEHGEAISLPNGLDWAYTTTQLNPVLIGSMIRFVATDIPGNTTILEVTI
jgi:hypothetical protein